MKKEDLFRGFIAIEIPEQIRSRLHRFQIRLQKQSVKASWVRPENIHVTLVFLGEVSPRRIDLFPGILDASAVELTPFTFAVSGLGIFGSPRNPRVVWAGIPDPPNELMSLQKAIQDRLIRAGFEGIKQTFHPHLTLGRIRGRHQGVQLTSAIVSAKNSDFGTVPVRCVLLVQSYLEAGGVRYAVIHESRLKGTLRHGNQNESPSSSGGKR